MANEIWKTFPPVRRVVTGHDANNVAKVLIDAPATNAKVFAAMKPTSYFINVARGGVVDEDALLAALHGKKIAGAALDVFNQEPLPPDHPFWDFKNVIITTHQGGFCDTYVDLAMPILEHNMRCFLKGDLQGMMNVARAAA